MANAIVNISSNFTQTNDQRIQRFYGTLTVTGRLDTYNPGGIPLDAALAAALLPTTGQAGPLRVLLTSRTGSGYIYQRIASTGKMMILQVPDTASLTTAGPLQELFAGATLSAVFADVIDFTAEYLRNAF
jgi:hypothetical protein